jgi:predicted metal-dependent hydrolase
MRRARRYILRIRPDGTLRVTIPRGGSRVEATRFMHRHLAWVARERLRVRRAQTPVRWTHGSRILLDGVPVEVLVEATESGAVARYGNRSTTVADPANVRGEIEADLRELARVRLIPQLADLAATLKLDVAGVSIRNQRTRWGSCSRKGVIALNFRLVQMPPEVAEYILIHELMHLRQQNHGPRFWRLVERACPMFRDSERWLRRHGRSLF